MILLRARLKEEYPNRAAAAHAITCIPPNTAAISSLDRLRPDSRSARASNHRRLVLRRKLSASILMASLHCRLVVCRRQAWPNKLRFCKPVSSGSTFRLRNSAVWEATHPADWLRHSMPCVRSHKTSPSRLVPSDQSGHDVARALIVRDRRNAIAGSVTCHYANRNRVQSAFAGGRRPSW
jgi:hypothetical protein